MIFQRDKLLLGCLGIAALCLDIFWLVVSQQDMELINYMPNKSIVLLTIALAICKLLFVAYMIIIEQAFTAD